MSQRSNQRVNLGEDGLPEVPELSSVPVKTNLLGALIVPDGAALYVIDEVTGLRGVATELRTQLLEKSGECDDLRSDLKTRDTELAAAKARSLESEDLVDPIDANGKPVPVASPTCFIWVTFPGGQQRIVLCSMPAEVNTSVNFGGEALGYRAVIRRVERPDPMDGLPPEKGYAFFVRDWKDKDLIVGKQFVPEQEFLAFLRSPRRPSVGKDIFGASFRMRAFNSLSEAHLAMMTKVIRDMLEIERRDKERREEEQRAKRPALEAAPRPAAQLEASAPSATQPTTDAQPAKSAGTSKPPPVPGDALQTAPYRKAVGGPVNGAAASTTHTGSDKDPPEITLEDPTA